MTDKTEALSSAQRERAAALMVARDALVTKAGVFGGSGAAQTADLIAVAVYVVTGSIVDGYPAATE